MAGEADFVADLGGILFHPGVRGVGQHLAADEGLDTAVLQQRGLLGILQVAVGLVFDDGFFAVDFHFVETVEGIGLGFAGFVDLADDRRGVFVAPAHGFVDLFEIGGGQFDGEFFQRRIHLVAEEVVVLEKVTAEFLAESCGGIDQAAVAFPGLGIQKFLFLLFG